MDGDGSTRGIIKITNSYPDIYTGDIWYDNNPEIDMISIHFTNETTGYVVGYNDGKGAIWKNGTGINTMSMAEEDSKRIIKVYPNPASKEINIEINETIPDNFTISLSDITGKQLYTQRFSNKNKININVGHLVKGIYLLIINTPQQSYTKKIVIN